MTILLLLEYIDKCMMLSFLQLAAVGESIMPGFDPGGAQRRMDPPIFGIRKDNKSQQRQSDGMCQIIPPNASNKGVPVSSIFITFIFIFIATHNTGRVTIGSPPYTRYTTVPYMHITQDFIPVKA